MRRFRQTLIDRFALPPGSIAGEAAAGASVAAVAIPVGLAYAEIVGVSPMIGLYASLAPTLAYALFGPSRYLIVGPDTAACMLIAATLSGLGLATPEARAPVVAGLALLTGLACFLAALLRMGFIASLFSRPVLVGYMTGVAVTLLASQIASWTRVDVHTTGLLPSLFEAAQRRAEIHLPTLAVAAGLFAGIRILKRLAPRAPAPALATIAAVALSIVLDLQARGVQTIGTLPRGLPAFRFPAFTGSAEHLAMGVLGILAISFASGILTARSFGDRLGETADANRELVGLGAANLAAGLFQGFGVSGADSRTAVGLSSGGRTRWTGIAAALWVALAVTVLTPFLERLPVAALGAILASAAIDLIDLRAFGQLARIGRHEVVFALVAGLGVIWIGVLAGVFLAVGLTLLHLLKLMSWPRLATRGRLPGQADLVSLDRHPEARPIPGAVICAFEASICFLNADVFRRRALEAFRSEGPAQWFVLDASLMSYIDSSALEALDGLRRDLEGLGAGLVIGGGHDAFLRGLRRTEFQRRLAGGRIFPSPEAAAAAIESGALAGEVRPVQAGAHPSRAGARS